MIKRSILIAVACLVGLTARGAADTYVGGVITTDTTWTAGNSPYIASASVLVANNATLIIEPGVEVRFAPKTALSVTSGQLLARGTETDRIRFTAHVSDKVTADDRWGYVGFFDSSVDATFDESGDYVDGSIIEYCAVEYAGGTDFRGAIHLDRASPYISNSVIRNNGMGGLYADKADGLRIEDSVIASNENLEYGTMVGYGGGIQLYSSDNVQLSRTEVSSNSSRWAGGGLFLHQSHDAELHEVTVSSNDTGREGGGGMLLWESDNIKVSSSSFHGNTAEDQGGGICVTGGASGSTSDGSVLSEDLNNPTGIFDNSLPQLYVGNVFRASAEIGGPGNVDARNVWWGTKDGATIQEEIYDFFDDASKALVFHEPWTVPGDGDANLDGLVEDNDLSLVLSNWTGPLGDGKTWVQGDFDGTGSVSDADLSLLLANWTGSADSAAIPEPATPGMVVLAGIALLRRRGR